jgi:hypothetical protein
MTEALLQDAILAYAELMGWRWYHPWLSVKSVGGYPDLTLCRPPRLVIAELKGPRGKVSPAQAAWLDDLQLCPGVEAHLWTPDSWLSGEIERVLR